MIDTLPSFTGLFHHKQCIVEMNKRLLQEVRNELENGNAMKNAVLRDVALWLL
jgi:hypothetical protein